MKPLATKGDRLNWTPLKEVKTVKLNSTLMESKRLSDKDLHDRRVSKNAPILMP